MQRVGGEKRAALAAFDEQPGMAGRVSEQRIKLEFVAEQRCAILGINNRDLAGRNHRRHAVMVCGNAERNLLAAFLTAASQ